MAFNIDDLLTGRTIVRAFYKGLERDDLIVVTPEGDRFAATGWRVRSSPSVVTAAAVAGEISRRLRCPGAGRDARAAASALTVEGSVAACGREASRTSSTLPTKGLIDSTAIATPS